MIFPDLTLGCGFSLRVVLQMILLDLCWVQSAHPLRVSAMMGVWVIHPPSAWDVVESFHFWVWCFCFGQDRVGSCLLPMVCGQQVPIFLLPGHDLQRIFLALCSFLKGSQHDLILGTLVSKHVPYVRGQRDWGTTGSTILKAQFWSCFCLSLQCHLITTLSVVAQVFVSTSLIIIFEARVSTFFDQGPDSKYFRLEEYSIFFWSLKCWVFSNAHLWNYLRLKF